MQNFNVKGVDPSTDTYTVTYTDPFTGAVSTTPPLAFNASAQVLQSALDQLVGAGNFVTVNQTIAATGVDSQQTITLNNAAPATSTWTTSTVDPVHYTRFQLSFKGVTTSDIAYTGNAIQDAANIEAALNAPGFFQPGGSALVTVIAAPPATPTLESFLITLQGSLALTVQPADHLHHRRHAILVAQSRAVPVPDDQRHRRHRQSGHRRPERAGQGLGADAYQHDHVQRRRSRQRQRRAADVHHDRQRRHPARCRGGERSRPAPATPAPVATITDAVAHTPATTATAQPTGAVENKITLTSGGAGYVTPPTVTFTPPTGPDKATNVTATGFATINAAGAVTGITILNPGSGYTSPPSIALTGGGVNGGAPTTPAVVNVASITLTITAVVVTNPGSGYTNAVNVTITDFSLLGVLIPHTAGQHRHRLRRGLQCRRFRQWRRDQQHHGHLRQRV